MSDNWCKICGEYTYGASHKCPPSWVVWCPDCHEEEEDGRKVFASDPGEAAEKWAEENDRDSAEYLIVGGSPATVLVKRFGSDDPPTRWMVSGEAVPTYSATEDPE